MTSYGETWDRSFIEQARDGAMNAVPHEAIVRLVSYHLRARGKRDYVLRYLDVGCGGGATLAWLVHRGVSACGVDVSEVALAVCRKTLPGVPVECCSVVDLPYVDETFDGVCEAHVIQHLSRADRKRAFACIRRVLVPGGAFFGLMLSRAHSTAGIGTPVRDDDGTWVLASTGPSYHLQSAGLTHFFTERELREELAAFSEVDLCHVTYDMPHAEARRRGLDAVHEAMWAIYAIK